MTDEEYNQALKRMLDATSRAHGQADVLLYQGSVDRDGYEEVSRLCTKKTGRTNVVAILHTLGGDAHAAFRIARCLKSRYEKFVAMVPRQCKSAGTLICIGADELVIADRGELGPLDVQVPKRDELLQLSSGLDLLQTLGYLQQNAFDAFLKFTVDLGIRTQLSTQIAAKMASELAVGLYGRIFEQIDPIKVGELQRSMLIASRYGEMLNERSKALKPGALLELVAGYPTHGFVIDRKEAKRLFHRVRNPTIPENLAGLCLCDEDPYSRRIEYLTMDTPGEAGQDKDTDGDAGEKSATDGNGAGGEGVTAGSESGPATGGTGQ